MFDELAKGWKNQKSEQLPSIDELNNKIGKMRKAMHFRNAIAITLLASSIIVISVIYYFFELSSLVSWIAFGLISLSILSGIGFLIYLRFILPSNVNAMEEGKTYIKQWQRFKKKNAVYSNNFAKFYFIVLSSGLILYIYEVTIESPEIRIIALISTSIWIAYCWFFMKPKLERKTEKELEEILDSYRSLEEQF